MCGCIMCTHGSLVEHGMVILGGLWWSFSHTWVCTNCSSLWMGCIISRLPDWCTIYNCEQWTNHSIRKRCLTLTTILGHPIMTLHWYNWRVNHPLLRFWWILTICLPLRVRHSLLTMCTGVHSYFSISSIISAILPKPPPSHQLSFPLTFTMER